MKGSLACGMAWVMVMWLSGCQTAGPVDPYLEMQRKAEKIRSAGGIAAAGMGDSRSQDLACDKAQVRARAEIGRILTLKISSLQKDFREEVGEAKMAEYNALFSEATKVLVSTELRGSVLKDIKYVTEGDQIRAYVIMVMEPKLVADYFAKEGQTYSRFRASQAFKELDEEVKKYEAFKLADKGM
jgi:hypothetical protein